MGNKGLVDVLLAVGFTAAGMLLGHERPPDDWIRLDLFGYALTALVNLPVVVRRWAPVGVCVFVCAAWVLYVAAGYWPVVNSMAPLLTLYTVAALRPVRTALACAALLGAVWVYAGLTAAQGSMATVAAQAVERAALTAPDVILMDIRMPGISGVVATERILAAAADPPPRILVLTTFDLDEYVYTALRAGASGFLLKDAGPDRLIAAVHAVAGGDTLFAPSVTRRLIEAYAPPRPGVPRPGVPPAGADRAPPAELAALTAREAEVLRLVARGLANPEIADLLFISEATVKTHLNRTMAKLDLRSRAQAVVLAYETGLVTPRGA